MIEIINKKTPYRGTATVIYCGRPSIFGNPFTISSTCSRDEACDNFHKWLAEQPEYSHIRKNIIRLAVRVLAGEQLALQCWCAPERCHAESIRDAIMIEVERMKNES